MRFVSMYDPWHHQDLKLAFTPNGPEKATITVTGKGIDDTWAWEAAGPDAGTVEYSGELGRQGQQSPQEKAKAKRSQMTTKTQTVVYRGSPFLLLLMTCSAWGADVPVVKLEAPKYSYVGKELTVDAAKSSSGPGITWQWSAVSLAINPANK